MATLSHFGAPFTFAEHQVRCSLCTKAVAICVKEPVLALKSVENEPGPFAGPQAAIAKSEVTARNERTKMNSNAKWG